MQATYKAPPHFNVQRMIAEDDFVAAIDEIRLAPGALQAADRARVLIQRLLAFARKQHLGTRAVDILTMDSPSDAEGFENALTD